MGSGPVEALRAAGATYGQIVAQAVIPMSITSVVSWVLESGLADRRATRAISEGCGDREIHGSDLGRMCALLQVRAEGDEVIGEDVKWALGIAVTALVLMAFLPHVPFVLVLGPWRTRGRVRDRNPRWRDRSFFVRTS